MRVAIVGATGMIGRRLTSALLAGGHEVLAISRRGESVADAPGVVWDPASGPLAPAALAGVDAVVNLAGASIGTGRWTPARKREIVDSRVVTTAKLVEAIGTDGPRILVNSSAVGTTATAMRRSMRRRRRATIFSGPPAVPGSRRRSRRGERGAGRRPAHGRRDCPGVGGDQASVAAVQARPRWPSGRGQQWWSWIHIDDITGLILFALTHPELSGPVNAVAPNAVRQREFARALGHVLGRPAVVPTPGFALKLAMGEMSAIALTGQHVIPRVAIEAGYRFAQPRIEAALRVELAPA